MMEKTFLIEIEFRAKTQRFKRRQELSAGTESREEKCFWLVVDVLEMN